MCHLILKLHVRLKACVLNNPYDPKHVTIPSNTFMPGKDGAVPRDISSLHGLVRLLHRQHFELFAALPPRDGFVLQDASHTNERTSCPEYVIPNRSDDYGGHFSQCDLQVGELSPSRRQTRIENVVAQLNLVMVPMLPPTTRLKLFQKLFLPCTWSEAGMRLLL